MEIDVMVLLVGILVWAFVQTTSMVLTTKYTSKILDGFNQLTTVMVKYLEKTLED